LGKKKGSGRGKNLSEEGRRSGWKNRRKGTTENARAYNTKSGLKGLRGKRKIVRIKLKRSLEVQDKGN